MRNSSPVVKKAKGVDSSKLTVQNYVYMYKYNTNITAYRLETKKSYEKGSVIFKLNEIVLNFDSYTKRQKIYDIFGFWIDTKALFYNDNKSLIVYEAAVTSLVKI